MAEYINKIDILTRQYNDAITALEESYDMESSQQGLLQKLTSSKLKRQYSEKYEELAQEYFGKRKTIFEEYKKANPQWTKTRKIWGKVFYIGIIFAMVCCSAAMPWSEEPSFAVGEKCSISVSSSPWYAVVLPCHGLRSPLLLQPRRLSATLKRLPSGMLRTSPSRSCRIPHSMSLTPITY